MAWEQRDRKGWRDLGFLSGVVTGALVQNAVGFIQGMHDPRVFNHLLAVSVIGGFVGFCIGGVVALVGYRTRSKPWRLAGYGFLIGVVIGSAFTLMAGVVARLPFNWIFVGAVLLSSIPSGLIGATVGMIVAVKANRQPKARPTIVK